MSKQQFIIILIDIFTTFLFIGGVSLGVMIENITFDIDKAIQLIAMWIAFLGTINYLAFKIKSKIGVKHDK